ncbi:unnamed protein product [Heligmosomoides polygyrus]|uniref:Uncharacterized protein n=1 Tax=Heligmosomoides polygyrus TaxID=6339 RepID=A0A183GRW1_HELPZ|nr:unnamed protein product [Heligmosomoides polygyrus]
MRFRCALDLNTGLPSPAVISSLEVVVRTLVGGETDAAVGTSDKEAALDRRHPSASHKYDRKPSIERQHHELYFRGFAPSSPQVLRQYRVFAGCCFAWTTVVWTGPIGSVCGLGGSGALNVQFAFFSSLSELRAERLEFPAEMIRAASAASARRRRPLCSIRREQCSPPRGFRNQRVPREQNRPREAGGRVVRLKVGRDYVA